MGLQDYKRELEREATLPRGVKCCLKQFGTPFYWRSFYGRLADLKIGRSQLEPDVEYDVRAWAMAEAVVVWIEDDGERITDTEAIYQILKDPTYWELMQDIQVESGKADQYVQEAQAEIKKSSPPTLTSMNSGA